jgi:hypothetical protein
MELSLKALNKRIAIFFSKLATKGFYLKRKLQGLKKKQDFVGTFEVIGLSNGNSKDQTIDQYISQHGGIFSHADNKVHTTKASYMEGMKASGCHIKDY